MMFTGRGPGGPGGPGGGRGGDQAGRPGGAPAGGAAAGGAAGGDGQRQRPTPEQIEQMRARMREQGPPPPTTVTMRFEDYKSVDGVRLPHSIVQSIDGKPVEEWTVEKIQGQPQRQGRPVHQEAVAVMSYARPVIALLVALGAGLVAGVRPAAAQDTATLRVSVQDQTEAVLLQAVVTVPGPNGTAVPTPVDARGVATITGLPVGTVDVTVAADGFRTMTMPVRLRRGDNQATIRLAVAVSEQIEVGQADAAVSKDDGFTTTLSPEEIDGLSDDPDEMADQLAEMAGPGAQIVVDGFRGGRLPPKDQIERIRFRTNMYPAEYHDAGMVRVEVSTRPGMGGWRSRMNFGFRDGSLNARNAFADEAPVEQVKRFQVSSQGPIVKGKTSLSMSADGNANYDAQTIDATDARRCGDRPGAAAERRDELQRPRGAVTRPRQLAARRIHAARPTLARTSASATSSCRSTPTTPRPRPTSSASATPRCWARRHVHRAEGRAHRLVDDQQLVHRRARPCRCSTPSPAAAPARYGTRDARQLVVDEGVDFTVHKHARRRPACCSRPAGGTRPSRPTPTARYTVLDPGAVRGRPGADLHAARRRPAGELLDVAGRLVHAGRLPRAQEPAT